MSSSFLRFFAVAAAAGIMLAACGSDSASTDEPVREAATEPIVIDGCTIKPNTMCQGVIFGKVSLPGVDLSGSDLAQVTMSGSDLSGANLSNAEIVQATMRNVDFSKADLAGTFLSESDLSGANFSGANLSGAYLDGANLYQADLSGANLSGVLFSDTTMPDGSCRMPSYGCDTYWPTP
jgi:uncharacterized protein YjbI with pentapeptide repeats